MNPPKSKASTKKPRRVQRRLISVVRLYRFWHIANGKPLPPWGCCDDCRKTLKEPDHVIIEKIGNRTDLPCAYCGKSNSSRQTPTASGGSLDGVIGTFESENNKKENDDGK